MSEQVPPRPPKAPSIRRRIQTPPTPALEAFIQAGEQPGIPAPVVETVKTAIDEPQGFLKLTQNADSRRTYLALLLSVFALGLSMLNHRRLAVGPELTPDLPLQAAATPAPNLTLVMLAVPGSQEIQRVLTTALEPAVLQLAASPPVAPPPAAFALPTTTWLAWLVLNDLERAREALRTGDEAYGVSNLGQAREHLARLGDKGTEDDLLLQRFVTEIADTPLLSTQQLDQDLEELQRVWLQITYPPASASSFALTGWLLWPWRAMVGDSQPPEMETTDAGRRLLTRLERLRWLASQSNETGLHDAAQALETLLTPTFAPHPAGQPWLIWVQRLQQASLRRNLHDLDLLIERLAQRVGKQVCIAATNTTQPCTEEHPTQLGLITPPAP